MTEREVRNKIMACLQHDSPLSDWFTRTPLINPDELSDVTGTWPGVMLQIGDEVFALKVVKLTP